MNMIGFARLREALFRGSPNRSAAAISATTDGRKEGRKEERKKGRKEGRKKGRKEGRKERINGRQQEDEESTQSHCNTCIHSVNAISVPVRPDASAFAPRERSCMNASESICAETMTTLVSLAVRGRGPPRILMLPSASHMAVYMCVSE